MEKMNQDIPFEHQMMFIVKDYDRKVEENMELRKEVEELSAALASQGAELKQAKKEAFANTPGAFNKLTQLNKRIDENAYIFDNAPIATGEGNIARNLEGYYEIKNSKYILAYVSINMSGDSEIRRWEFVKKSDVVTNSEVIQ